MESIPDMVLRGRGVVFRLEAYWVRVVRGRTTWTVPLAAISDVGYAEGRVRLELAAGGEGDSVTLTTRNTTAADAFVRRLRDAVSRVPTAENGPAMVIAEHRERPRLRLPGRPLVWLACLAVVPYFWYFGTAIKLVGGDDSAAGALLGVSMLYCPWGVVLLVKGWRDVVRDALILWRRGITVPGRVRAYKWSSTGSDGSGEYRPVYEFRTLEGHKRRVTQSVAHTHKGEEGPVDVTYDPLSPTRVRGERQRQLLVRGTVMMFFGVLSVVLLLVPLCVIVVSLLTD
ncbi:hypothetical protein SSP35_12_01090 [Streptomyces sp. NBRC 110611]|uniref:DUF3592 domain-containing protein n=1 Tax=Streptomyces sp. NBRC 110611 TaxID=1621259 RepID=UPI000858181F|nr:DUF3592 domain-containing protein [Streptomyces sp. NBRC 110611]GAU69461.1 hypothetical protein SSP35_12_01090 [Streptomyces sp. NBRC 110611]